MKINVVITGANRGIGLELCRTFQKQGAEVIGICRTASEAIQGLGIQVIEGIDVTNPAHLHSLQEKLKDQPIDILINNAGILSSETVDKMDFEGILRQFAVNTLGPLRVTMALLKQFRKGSKVAMITSRMGSLSDNTSGGYYGYRMSKAALNAAGVSLAQDLRSHEIAVGLFHPGFVQTEMVGNAGDISPQVAAERLSQRIAELNLENTGTFWHSNGEVLPW